MGESKSETNIFLWLALAIFKNMFVFKFSNFMITKSF